MMFMGEFSHTIDAKGRLIIPSKFREALGDNIVVTVGLDKCLTLYTEDEFQNRASDLVSQTSLKGNVRALQRYMLSKAQNAEFDKQGRILISANLREFANLKKDVILAGVGNYIEIWDKDEWDKVNSFDNIEEIAEELSDAMFTFSKEK